MAPNCGWSAQPRRSQSCAELQLGIMQLEREGSPPPGLRLPQAKLSRKSNQVARGRIRRFESYMPATQSVSAVSAAHVEEPARSRTSGPTSGPPSGYFLDKGLLCDALHISGEALRPYRRCRFH